MRKRQTELRSRRSTLRFRLRVPAATRSTFATERPAPAATNLHSSLDRISYFELRIPCSIRPVEARMRFGKSTSSNYFLPCSACLAPCAFRALRVLSRSSNVEERVLPLATCCSGPCRGSSLLHVLLAGTILLASLACRTAKTRLYILSFFSYHPSSSFAPGRSPDLGGRDTRRRRPGAADNFSAAQVPILQKACQRSRPASRT